LLFYFQLCTFFALKAIYEDDSACAFFDDELLPALHYYIVCSVGLQIMSGFSLLVHFVFTSPHISSRLGYTPRALACLAAGGLGGRIAE
jgi:hypothetical protein